MSNRRHRHPKYHPYFRNWYHTSMSNNGSYPHPPPSRFPRGAYAGNQELQAGPIAREMPEGKPDFIHQGAGNQSVTAGSTESSQFKDAEINRQNVPEKPNDHTEVQRTIRPVNNNTGNVAPATENWEQELTDQAMKSPSSTPTANVNQQPQPGSYNPSHSNVCPDTPRYSNHSNQQYSRATGGFKGQRDHNWSHTSNHHQYQNRQWQYEDQRGYPGHRRRGGYHQNAPYSMYERDQYEKTFHGRRQDHWSSSSSDASPGKRYREEDPLVFLSKTLSFLLRHGAQKQGFKLLPGGFLFVDEILEMRKLEGYRIKDVEEVVHTNDKKRFALKKDEKGRLMIRANQGHTMEVDDLELTPITSSDQVKDVIHGTYHRSWELIKNEGLCRMGRNHIHFAVGEPGQNEVISGMRTTCEVMIYIDMEKALKGGLKFFRSANNVILSPGDEKGYIYPCFFKIVVQRSPKMLLQFDSSISARSGSVDHASDKRSKKQKKKKNKNKQQEGRENGESRRTERQKQEDRDIGYNEDVDMDTSLMFAEDASDKMEEDWDNDSEQVVEQTTQAIEVKLEVKSDLKPEVKQEECECVPTSQIRTEEQQVAEASGWEPDSQESARSLSHVEHVTGLHKVLTVDECKEMINTIQEKSPALAVTYCGKGLGTKDVEIQCVALTGCQVAYVIPLQLAGDDVGTCLGKLLMDKDTTKVFFGVQKIAEGLLKQYNILLTDAALEDIQVMNEKLKNNLSKEEQQTLDKIQFDPESWLKQDKKLKFGKDEKKLGERLIERGRSILQVYEVFSRFDGQQKKEVKKATYANVRFLDESHWLAEKYEELTKAQRNTKSKKKTGGASAEPQQKEHQKQGGKSGSPKKKKNK